MKKEPGENCRQFYERFLQLAQLHLAQATADGLSSQVADKMSISIMNHMADHWLRKIYIQIPQIVKTEYSTELRSREQLAALIPRIAPNVDSLVLRKCKQSVRCHV